MGQFPSQPNPQNPLEPYQIPPQIPSSPKIKPPLQRSCKENQLNETNYQRSLKTHSKVLTVIKTYTNKTRNSFPQYIKGYRKILTAQDPLSELFYSFNSNVYFENLCLFSKTRSLRTLKSLEVLFFSNYKRPIPLKALFKNLAYLKDLTHFKIELNFYYFADTDAEILDILFRSLRRLKNLKSLSLTFRGCSNFEKGDMKNLPQYLRRLKQLESLELSFNESRELTDQDMISLASVLPKLSLLAQIKLNFGSLPMEGRTRRIQGSTLIQVLQNAKTLSEITLNLGHSDVIDQEAFHSLSEGLRQLHAPSLKKFSLHLNKNIDSQGLIELSHTLKRFISLDILQLDLLGCRALTNDGAAEFGSALSSLTTLSSFSLRVHSTIQADFVIECIASGIKSLHNLVNLNLNFASNMRSSPDQDQRLAASLANLTSLKFLEISFSQGQSLSDDVMEELAESLLKLTQLKHLALNFEYANMLTNKGVESLTNAIQTFHGLSFLDLNFSCKEIDEKAIENIAQALRHLPRLYSLLLIFCQCPKLRREKKSFTSLFTALREITNIKEVTLYLAHNDFTEQEVNDLKQRKLLTTTWGL